MRARWLLALLPLGLGVLLAGLAVSGILVNKVYYLSLQGDLAALALLPGSLLSAAAAAYLLLQGGVQKIRQREIAQAQAQAGKERRRFLRRLDHELKNPLTAIRAGLANLDGAGASESQQQALSSVKAQVLRLSRLSSDLRKLAELETRPLERAPVDVGDLLQEVLKVVGERSGAAQRRLALTVPQAPWPLPPVDGDPDLLFLAVHNLVDNALKFTAPGDTVEVRAFEDGAMVSVEVADTGPGIPAEEMPHVWQELYRGQGARGLPGSGLGLALAQAIVQRHGGQAELRSRAGQGTVVCLRLPVS